MSWLSKGIKKLTSNVKGAWQDFTGQTAWREQAEYNTPANQMARYRAAGLNPNLIYGEGQSTSAGNMSSPAGDYQGGFDAILSLINMARGVVDIKKENADIENSRLSTLSSIEHSKDVLDLEKKKMMIDSIFRDKEFDFRKHSSDRDYALRKAAQVLNVDKWNYEKGHIDKYGTKPGTTIDFLNVLLGNVMGKPVTDVGTDTYNILNTAFGNAFAPVTDALNFGRTVENVVKSLVKDMVKGFAGQARL